MFDRFFCRLFCTLALLAVPVSAWAEGDELEAITDIGKLARSLVMTVFWLVLAAIVIFFGVLLVRRIMYNVSIKKVKSDVEQIQDEIDGHLEKGDHAAAAAVYYRIGEPEKAARLYIKGNQFAKAAAIYEQLENPEKAIEQYIRAGESLKAASLHIRLKNYYEAAKIFKNKGDLIRAAQALEMYGNKLGAAKEYKLAGEYLKAAKLYKDLNLYPETAEMFRLQLEGKEVDESTAGQYYMFGSFLALTEQNDAALEVFSKLHAYDPGFRDVAERIESLNPKEATAQQETTAQEEVAQSPEPAPQEVVTDAAAAHADVVEQEPYEPDDIEALIEQEISRRDGTAASAEEGAPSSPDTSSLRHETNLKSMIHSHSLEPKYAMKLWVEILRTLKAMHDRSQFIGVLSPHTIHIDMENNVRIEPPTNPPPAYLSPEFADGATADVQTDIYSAGVLLFEMATGSLEDFGVKNPSQINGDIPEWLDELVLRATDPDREHRYQNLDDIYSKLIELREQM